MLRGLNRRDLTALCKVRRDLVGKLYSATSREMTYHRVRQTTLQCFSVGDNEKPY